MDQYKTMRDEEDSKRRIIEGLDKAAKSNARSKTVRLREIYDDIEAAKAKGASLKQIVTALNEGGLEIDMDTFVNLRSRIKKERQSGKSIVFEQSAASVIDVQAAAPTEPIPQGKEIARPKEKKADSIALAQKYTGGGESSFLDGILNNGENKK